MIILDNISKTYRQSRGGETTAVRNVSLRIDTGEVFGLIGYSGAGKSTLLRCINLLERPSAGSVIVDGVDLTHLSKRELNQKRRKIGMIFQHFHLLSSATVAENIAFPLRLAKMPAAQVRARVAQMLQLVGLTGYERQYPSQLSGGQKQRVAIARALAAEPSVLLCDEATSALDPETTKSILSLLKDINRQLGLTIVMVTHQMEVVRDICDRVAVMTEGAIVESGRVLDVLLKPSHDVTKRLFQLHQAPLSLTVPPAATRVIEIAFTGATAHDPILADVAQSTGCTFSILRGTIDTVKDVPFGQLTIAWFGEKTAVDVAIVRLEQAGFMVLEERINDISPQATEVTVSC
ncbi:methionine ABC transporter ATP-binding protein [Alicyclobacillus acidoterrestris]|uniref:methionine ABC transporter ATP-binding protein n=1 Tax=Alicyclobacillus acidoterrestris TaxID=1450 RepID=UPI003F53221B